MSDTFVLQFCVRRRGGKSAGDIVRMEVPKFDWAVFRNSPNAEQFARRAFLQAERKIALDRHEGRLPYTMKGDFTSVEAVLAESLSYSPKQIDRWLETRDLSTVELTPREQRIFASGALLLRACENPNLVGKSQAARLFELIATLADPGPDNVADFLSSGVSRDVPEILDSDLQ